MLAFPAHCGYGKRNIPSIPTFGSALFAPGEGAGAGAAIVSSSKPPSRSTTGSGTGFGGGTLDFLNTFRPGLRGGEELCVTSSSPALYSS